MSLDPRVAFYLRHRALIDQWQELPKLHHRAAHRFYCELKPHLEELAEDLGEDVALWGYTDGKLRRGIPPLYVLYRHSWGDKARKLNASIGVAFEWPKAKPTFFNAYAGVRIYLDQSETCKAHHVAINRAVEHLVRDSSYEGNSEWWPASRFERPSSPDYWEDLDAWRTELLGRIRTTWNTFAPLIDQVIQETAP